MKTPAILLTVAAAMAVGLLVERWATPWTNGLLRKGRITPYQCSRLWAILVVGSSMIAYTFIEPVALDLLK